MEMNMAGSEQNGKQYLRQLLHLPEIFLPHLSPDGKWVAFEWYRIHANLDVFLVPTDGSAPPVALTHTPEFTTFESWTSDSRAVIVSEDHDRDEYARLFKVDIQHPGEMQSLTEDRPPYFIRGGFLHPDGRTLFYGANYDFAAGKVIEPTLLYRYDLQSGERKSIALPSKPAWMFLEMNLAGTHLTYSRKDHHPSGQQIFLVDIDGQEDLELFNFGEQVKVWSKWFYDSQRILVKSESKDGRQQEHYSVGVYNMANGELSWLLDDPARNIEEVGVSPDNTILLEEVREAQRLASFMDPDSGEETALPRLPGNMSLVGRAADGAWIGIYYASTSPTELVRIPLDASSAQDLVSLTHVWEHTELKPAQLTAAEDFRWKSEDGLEIQGWLYRAQPNPKRAIVYVHGGPTWHSEDAIKAQVQYFTSRGFNVLDVNYRGSTGFGLRFKELIKEDGWGGREQEDITTGAQALIQAGLADPGRVGVTGTSYGGYSSYFQITHAPPEVIGAAAPICGMTDLVVDYTTTRPDLRPYSAEMMGGTPEEVPERYFERSPINFVRDIKGQLLIIQGALDPNVTPENVRQVRNKLEESGIPYDLLVFDDEGHGIVKLANQERLYACLADFFDESLGS
jgi:dipeptidyl aminopeptidase/acylaminoacyl peptidase